MGHKVRLSKKGKDVQLFAAAQGAGAEISVEPDIDFDKELDRWRKSPQECKEEDEEE